MLEVPYADRTRRVTFLLRDLCGCDFARFKDRACPKNYQFVLKIMSSILNDIIGRHRITISNRAERS